VPFEMLDVGPPLTDARIAKLERELGIKLPDGYRSFLSRYNGGHPKPAFFPIQGLDNNPFGSIHYFFGVDRLMQSNHIDWNYRTYAGRIPRELLPIAGDEGGNIICLSLRESNKDAVYYWDHDDEHSPPTYRNLYLIAQTFDRFLDSIHFEDISAEVAKSLGRPVQRPH
jgi:SMI1 / KNR4 family (SUKH-1)